MHRTEVIRRPVVTEKTDLMGELHNQYVFEVHPRANKRQIREAVEATFDVDVLQVRTMMMPGKPRRWGRHESHTSAWKKAVVTLAEGQAIDLYE
jgi:large subunit ribosomal protein L23